MVARVIDHPSGAGVIPTPYNPDPALLAIVEIIRAGLIRDQHVRLHQFGTFRLRWSMERRVKHPKTGEHSIVPPAPKITFTPARQLQEWIEPDRKPVIPLDDPFNKTSQASMDVPQAGQENKEVKTDSIKEQTVTESQQHNQPNLHETVQDIIDEQYSPPDSLSEFTNPQPVYETETQADTSATEPNKPNKKWALGLLAAVPLIIFLLQSDFKNDTSRLKESTTPEMQTGEQSNSLSDPILNNAVFDNRTIRGESTLPDNQQSNTDSKSSELVTARSEPTPKPFYMSPQVHAIQQGDNLWNLAKQFYGDAMLWPHIYRANTRTLGDPDKIISGKNLVIPGLQESPELLSRKDKELISEGYFLVYEYKRINNPDQAIHFLIGAKQYSLEWLRQKKSQINEKDWKTINT